MSNKFNVTVSYNGEELEVSGEEYEATIGAKGSYGEPLDPDEDGSIEISTVLYKGVDVWNILEAAADDIEELVWSELYAQSEAAAESAAEAEYESRKERGL